MFTKKRVLGAVSTNHSMAGTINLVILAAVILWIECTMPPYDKAAIEAKLQGDRKPAFHELAVGGRTIFYAETGDTIRGWTRATKTALILRPPPKKTGRIC